MCPRATTVERERRKNRGRRRARRDSGNGVQPGAPTPQEWAREQVKNAPTRSAEWARAVARIYGLDVEEK